MLLAVHHRSIVYLGSLERTQEARIVLGATRESNSRSFRLQAFSMFIGEAVEKLELSSMMH